MSRGLVTTAVATRPPAAIPKLRTRLLIRTLKGHIMKHPTGQIELTLADDVVKTETYSIHGAIVCYRSMAYSVPDYDGNAPTIKATLTSPTGQEITLTGDQWRALESEGDVECFLRLLALDPVRAELLVTVGITAVLADQPIYRTLVTRPETASATVLSRGDEDPATRASCSPIALFELDEGNIKPTDAYGVGDAQELDLAEAIEHLLQEAQAAAERTRQAGALSLVDQIAHLPLQDQLDGDMDYYLESHATLLRLIADAKRLRA